MNPVIDKLLSQVYELEGLLLVIDKHEGDVTPYLYELVQKKAERIMELAPSCTLELFNKKEPEVRALEEDVVQDEVIVQEPEPEASQDSFIEPFSFVEPKPELESEPELEQETEELPEPIEEMPYEDDFVQEDDFVEDDLSEEPEDDEFIDEDPIRLDEAFQRSMSKDLSKAFSLNDRFRYRRELFGNSEVEMRNTINMVEAMHSFSEAEDYFYGDLEWDKESPEVADFMTIIRNHFL